MIFTFCKIEKWIYVYKYIILYPIMVIEGPIITVIAGYLVYIGKLNAYLTYLILVAGDVTGDTIYYFLGKYSKNSIFCIWKNVRGSKEGQVKNIENYIRKHIIKTLLIGKWSHGIGAPILMATGMSRISYIKFFIISLLTTMPKTLLLLLCGYYLGKSYTKIRTLASYLDYFGLGTITILFLIILFYLLIKRYSKNFFD